MPDGLNPARKIARGKLDLGQCQQEYPLDFLIGLTLKSPADLPVSSGGGVFSQLLCRLQADIAILGLQLKPGD